MLLRQARSKFRHGDIGFLLNRVDQKCFERRKRTVSGYTLDQLDRKAVADPKMTSRRAS